MNHRKVEPLAGTSDFSVRLPPSRAGARLARELAAGWLRDRAAARGVVDDALQVVAELAANAALHGRVPGRDFLLVLRLTGTGRALRIEASDTRAERVPASPRRAPLADGESGRGLLIVDALADRWGVDTGPVPRKTVWAELDLVPEHGRPGSGGPGGLFQGTEGKKEPLPTPPLPPHGRPHPVG
ncbi:ATP-binding protein [Streptomyces somaliensis]|uniref:ATP-binding protein n=1 Tax=Streptomyces somaliensis TaxID=78355 RepID=UPI0020CC0EFD|nr:ATP-binding protein [Streptomyces somaliensis]MCP9944977.1 ATP-binding protein [Streptomyces somaliensis]MCP9974620.1 ATP-binding protein [Streptomyces somaliensis]